MPGKEAAGLILARAAVAMAYQRLPCIRLLHGIMILDVWGW
jgi:hypothetical protein